MIHYSHEGGYGNENIQEAREVVEKYLPVGSGDKVIMLSLLYDYKILRKVVDGEAMFSHEDGSKTIRIKFYRNY